jgi:hypothetical protein
VALETSAGRQRVRSQSPPRRRDGCVLPPSAPRAHSDAPATGGG